MSESKEKRRTYWQNFMEKLKSDPQRYEGWKRKRVEQTKDWRKRNPKKARACDKRKIEKMGRKKYNASRLLQYNNYYEHVEAILGKKCAICNYEPTKTQRRINYHEIHGRKHPHTPNYILNHIKDFVPLCKTHHMSVHHYHWYKSEIKVLEKMIEDKNQSKKEFHIVIRNKNGIDIVTLVEIAEKLGIDVKGATSLTIEHVK